LPVPRIAIDVVAFLCSRLENRAAFFPSGAGSFDSAKNFLPVRSFEEGFHRSQAIPREILLHRDKGFEIASLVGDTALVSGGTR
jgi:hypothetical protein